MPENIRPRLAANGKCRSCHAQIHWARTADGRAIPMDLEARAGGNMEIAADPRTGESVVEYRHPEDGAPRYVSHFVTCPQAAEHRRKREVRLNSRRAGVKTYRNDAARFRVENPWRGHW